MRAVTEVTERARPRTAPATVRPVQGTGVAVVPNARLAVRFVAPSPGARLRVVFAAGSRASLVPEGGDASFAIQDGAILVSNATAPAFLLTVPASLAELRVERDGTLLLRKHGSLVVTNAVRDASGTYVVALDPGKL